ncbi:MAG: CDP-alcohol phosphatidyltransferase family protein [Methanobacteriota archaeon]
MLEALRHRIDGLFSPFVSACLAAGVSPNVVTAASFALAILAGAAFAGSSPAAPDLLVAGAFLVIASAYLDAADGQLARRSGTASVRGDFLDHVLDRYADLAILLGLTFSPWVDWRIGLFAIVGTLLTSYMGTQAQALGLGRMYGGLISRADRLTIVFSAGMLQYLVGARVAVPYAGNFVALALVVLAVLGNVTAVQRAVSGWRGLRATSERP